MKFRPRKKIVMITAASMLILSTCLAGCGNNAGASSTEVSSVSLELPSNRQAPPETEVPSAASPEEAENPSAASPADQDTNSSQLEGNIEQINPDSFVISKIFVEKADDGSMLAFSPGPNAPDSQKTLITVTFSDSTKFIKRTIKNGGNDSSDAAATKEALETGKIVAMQGKTTDSGFEASEIIINTIQ